MLNAGAPPILQFGTGRFLQAHVALFVSEALARGQALGPIAVVQSTDDPASARRLAALAGGAPYPVRLRGLQGGAVVDRTVQVGSVGAAWHVARDWPRLRAAVAGAARVIVSNTADRGYALDPADRARLLDEPHAVPRSFPARLLVLLHQRWREQPDAPMTLLPCELVARNGDTLRDLVTGLGRDWGAPPALLEWLRGHCVWANSLVDRIVSAPLDPVGAVAEPYALWAIERQPGLVLPCAHEAIVLTDSLARAERLKLWLLNLGHSVLAEAWLAAGGPDGQTVLQAMRDTRLRALLEAVWRDEVLPVFAALGEGDAAAAYLGTLRERLLNPFLAHRLADIAQNHADKKRRRFGPVVEAAQALGLRLAQPALRDALAQSVPRAALAPPR